MKVFLRIVILVAAAGAWVYSFWPKEDDSLVSAPLSTPSLTPTTPASGSFVTDLLGGRQIREGQKAREVIKRVDAQRDADFSEIE